MLEVTSVSLVTAVAVISHPTKSSMQCRVKGEVRLKIRIELTVHIISEGKSCDTGS